MKLPISAIRLDGGTQPRTSINEAVVSEYAEAMLAGQVLPAPVVFFDGSAYWLADGFHRVHAARQAGMVDMGFDMRTGTKREAIQFSLGANATHGLRRSNEDKRRAVRMALDDPEWAALPNREIARMTGTTHPFVADMREAMKPAPKPEGGNVSSQDAPRREDNTKSTPPPAPRADQQPGNVSTSKPGKVEAEPEASDGPTLAEIADEQQREIERLQGEISAMQADDQKAEALKLRRLADNAQRQQSEAMEKARRAEDREAFTKRQLMRCGKAVGVTDPDQIAPAVEALARRVKVAA